MFTITSTRIAGLIAVVCAFVVAPQALATSSTHSRIFLPGDEGQGNDPQALAATSTHSRIAAPGDPSDVIQRYLLRGELSDHGFAPPAFAAAPHKSLKAGSKAAAIEALQRRSVALEAVYRKLWPSVYKKAVEKNVKAGAWSFPSCTPSAAAEYDSYIYSGDPCIMTAPAGSTVGTIVLAPAIERGVVSRNPVSQRNAAFCNGSEEYDYIFSGC